MFSQAINAWVHTQRTEGLNGPIPRSPTLLQRASRHVRRDVLKQQGYKKKKKKKKNSCQIYFQLMFNRKQNYTEFNNFCNTVKAAKVITFWSQLVGLQNKCSQL